MQTLSQTATRVAPYAAVARAPFLLLPVALVAAGAAVGQSWPASLIGPSRPVVDPPPS